MLITECGSCGARFRASPEQLNQRQGLVRCGQCQHVFNAFESVVRMPAAGKWAQESEPAGPAPAPAVQEAEIPLIETRATAADAEGAEGAEKTAAVLEDLLPAQVRETPARSGKFSKDAYPPEPAETVTPARTRLPRAWSFGVALLLTVLGVQLTYAYRAQIALRYPALRPALESACAQAGCRVPWPKDEAALRLEDSEMLEVPGKPGQIALQARIRNMATYPQEYPHLELTLTDVTGQTAIRRVLRPADYLGTGTQAVAVMAAGSEALLSVRLETGRIHATGYELLLFHP